jgi:Opacity protein and related surface antigens
MRTTFLAGVALAFAGVVQAQAADIYQPVPEAPVVEAPVVEPVVSVASGWYLRGDVGYSWNRLRGADFFQGSNATYVPFATASLRNSYSVGGGIGYQATDKLRFDATFDYFGGAKFRGSTVGGCGVAVACVSTDISKLSAYSLMANAYVDFAKFGRVTTYVGAGLGGTHVRWSDLENTSCSAANPALCDPTVRHGGAGSWRFTYALMAGASVDVTCNLKADVGYRFRQVQGGKMFGYALNGGPGYDRGFSSHEVRGGLRYSFGGCAEPVYPEPEPIYPQPVYK